MNNSKTKDCCHSQTQCNTISCRLQGSRLPNPKCTRVYEESFTPKCIYLGKSIIPFDDWMHSSQAKKKVNSRFCEFFCLQHKKMSILIQLKLSILYTFQCCPLQFKHTEFIHVGNRIFISGIFVVFSKFLVS